MAKQARKIRARRKKATQSITLDKDRELEQDAFMKLIDSDGDVDEALSVLQDVYKNQTK